MKNSIRPVAISLSLLLSACAVAPTAPPVLMTAPSQYKETGTSQKAVNDTKLVPDAWWMLFNDTVLNLDSSVERARVGCWRRVWVGATTWNATAFEEEQHPQTRRQQLNRVHRALTQEVNSIEATNINVHNGLVKITSGQLRNLG